jgi:hypothetical protein
MTRHCANWTPLLRGQTIRLEQCETTTATALTGQVLCKGVECGT